MPRVAAEPPNLNTQAGRLRWARENAGYSSPRSAALALEWNENTYKSHENGIRQAEGLKERHIKKYARAFGVSEAWLATGRGAAIQKRDPLDELTEEDRDLALRLLKAAKRG